MYCALHLHISIKLGFSECVRVCVHVCVCVCVCVCHNEKKCQTNVQARQVTPCVTSSKQQHAQRKENYNKSKRCVSSVDHCHRLQKKKEM